MNQFQTMVTKCFSSLVPIVYSCSKATIKSRSSELATYQELISFYRLRLQCVWTCTSGFVSQIGAGQLYFSIYLRFLLTLPHIPVLLCFIWLVACVGPWECPKHTDFGLWDCKWAFFLFNICHHVSRIPILSSSDRNVETTRSTLTVVYRIFFFLNSLISFTRHRTTEGSAKHIWERSVLKA